MAKYVCDEMSDAELEEGWWNDLVKKSKAYLSDKPAPVPAPAQEQEPNPKKMFTDWTASILLAAQNGKSYLKHGDKTSEYDIDNASDCFGEIIGLCRAMSSVLKNVR